MIHVDNNFLKTRIIGSHKVLTSFPMLQPFRSQVQVLEKRCQTCRAGEARQQLADVLNKVRQLIANLPPSEKQRLRAALEVPESEKIFVAYRANGPDGKPVLRDVTF